MYIYKICTRAMWDEMQHTGVFPGMEIDHDDGYIHFSTREQNEETARKYFAGKTGLMLLKVDAEKLGAQLRWEPSSSGMRPGDFPHLYGLLTQDSVVEATTFFVPAHDVPVMRK
jgi:uncharacterized protein (DUF952 family)